MASCRLVHGEKRFVFWRRVDLCMDKKFCVMASCRLVYGEKYFVLRCRVDCCMEKNVLCFGVV